MTTMNSQSLVLSVGVTVFSITRLNSQSLVLGSSWTKIRTPFSSAPKAVNTVALVSVPLSVSARSVRPWRVKFKACVFMAIMVYSPHPLKVYDVPSKVVMCGSPNIQAERVHYLCCLSGQTEGCDGTECKHTQHYISNPHSQKRLQMSKKNPTEVRINAF